MYLPPLQPIANSEIQICGDVEIHPSASIAPGVILKAASNFRIVIGADVCLGMGVIISASNGSIEIDAGVTLGSGVLIIGSGKIGANSCIGTTTTIFNASINPMTVINPGSIIGDNSRSWQEDNNCSAIDQENKKNKESKEDKESKEIDPQESDNSKSEIDSHDKEVIQQSHQEPDQKISETDPEITNVESNSHDAEVGQQNGKSPGKEATNNSASITDFDPWESENIAKVNSQIEVESEEKSSEVSPEIAIGKVYIDQLLVTLFPHRNS